MRPLVERPTIGSRAGNSGSFFTNDSAAPEESATTIVPPRSSYVEPGSYPHILNRQSKSQNQFHRKRKQNTHSKKLKSQVLQQACSREDLSLEFLLWE